MMGSMNASQCDLAEQGFAGSVSDYSSSGCQSTFTLTLATTHFCEHDWYERRHRLPTAGYRALRLDEHCHCQTLEVRGLGVFRMFATRILNP